MICEPCKAAADQQTANTTPRCDDAVEDLVTYIQCAHWRGMGIVSVQADIRADLAPYIARLRAQWAADTAPGVGP